MFHLVAGGRPDADVVVVGAGPAGAATAARLAGRGLEVLLVDRKAFPRDKVCGDFLSPTAVDELAALGVAGRPEFAAVNAVSGAALHLDGEPLIERSLPEFLGAAVLGRVVPRLELDAWIVEAAVRAGARLLEGHTVNGFARTDGGVILDAEGPRRLRRRLRARLAVGADGSGSLLARILRSGPHPRADRIVAVRAYYEGIRAPDEQAQLYFSASSFPGYAWLFPTGGGAANVGVGMVLETHPPHDRQLKALLEQLVVEDAALRRHLQGARLVSKPLGWPLATYNPRLAAVGDGLLLVGDAAGLINPLNGEGIQYALASARWAAEEIAAAAEGPFTAERLAPYAERLERELSVDMALARLVVQLISNRRLNPFWLLALRAITERAAAHESYGAAAGGILIGLAPAQVAAGEDFLAATIEQVVARIGRRAFDPRGVLTGLETTAALLREADETAAWARSCAAAAAAFALEARAAWGS